MPHYPKVIIQILHFRDINDTLECLDSVFKLEYPNLHILVIDNSGKEISSEPTLEKLREQGRIELIETDENKGFSGGHNLGFKYSLENCADFIWVLNNDSIVMPDTLKKLVADIEPNVEIAAVSPIIYYYGTDKLQYFASIIDLNTKQISYTRSCETLNAWENDQKGFCLWGTAILIRASVLKEIGFFDENLFAYWEDTDLCYRILKKNYKTKISIDSKIYHKSEHKTETTTVLRRPHFYFYMARNEFIFLKNHCTYFALFCSLRKYFAHVLEQLLVCINNNSDVCANAVLDGIFCGFKGDVGLWKNDRHMPKFIAWFLKKFSWKLHRILTLT